MVDHHSENFLVGIQIVSILSVFASFCVLVTLVAFREMRSKLFMRIIAYISLSDMLGNFPYVLPYRPHHGPWCIMQGLINITFYPMSWLWTLALAYLLYFLATENRFPSEKFVLSINVVCWGLPVFLTALSTTCTIYGYSTFGIYPYEVCIFRKETDAVIYHGIFYYGLLVLCWVLMVMMKRRLIKLQAASLSPSYQIARTSLSLYPPALIVCWFPHCILFLVGFVYHERYGFYFMSDVLKLSHGVVTAAIFFYKSPEARRLWSRLFYLYIVRWFVKNKSIDDDRLSESENDLQVHKAFWNEGAQSHLNGDIPVVSSIHDSVEIELADFS
jgi:hypothetical protein